MRKRTAWIGCFNPATFRAGSPQEVAEVLGVTPAVRAMIRDEKSHQIRTVSQTNCESGMRTLMQSLNQIVQAGRIAAETAARICESEGEASNPSTIETGRNVSGSRPFG